MQLPEERLKETEHRFEEIERLLSDPDVAGRPDDIKALGKEHSELKPLVEAWRSYRDAQENVSEAKSMLVDASSDDKGYLDDEIRTQEAELDRLAADIAEMLIPKDPNDERNVIIEVRAGAGGDEAGLFAAELFRMYQRFAESNRWKTEILSTNESGIGGYKEAIFEIKGKGAWSRLKHEGGVHRVQRVPVTESSGRIHTSTASVLVLPEAEEVDVQIDPNELRIDVYRSSGPGGQSVNTTDSAVRITHLPTGEVVSCQDEKSQLQNKEKALRILRARLLQLEQERQQQEQSAARKEQVRSADRSERIRTYNYPENRVSDHRINLTLYRLAEILEGDIDELVDALVLYERRQSLGDDS
jgi:peptide chain release factor 1